MIGTAWSLLPPIVAIALALKTKEVYSSLFIGIILGAVQYCISMGTGFDGFLVHLTNHTVGEGDDAKAYGLTAFRPKPAGEVYFKALQHHRRPPARRHPAQSLGAAGVGPDEEAAGQAAGEVRLHHPGHAAYQHSDGRGGPGAPDGRRAVCEIGRASCREIV